MNRPYTTGEIEEYVKCRDDIFYFMKNYVVIQTLDGLESFNPNQTQIDLIKRISESHQTEDSYERMAGITTAMCAYILHCITFNPETTTAIVTCNMRLSIRALDIIRGMIHRLPDFLKVEFNRNNKTEIALQNYSNVIAVSSNAPERLRGYALNLIFFDNVCHYKEHDMKEMFAMILPAIPASGKVVIVT